MAFTLEDKIFTLYGHYDKEVDPYKDANGFGLLERYNRVMGKDFDTNIGPNIDLLIDNTIVPSSMLVRFLGLMEDMLGMPVLMPSNTALRRKLILYAIRLFSIRGTKASYEMLFRFLGFQNIVIIENVSSSTFDADNSLPIPQPGRTFDSDTRTFDNTCEPCSTYVVKIYGTIVLTEELHKAIFTSIAFCEPINAILDKVYFNDTLIIADDALSVFIDVNGDLQYDDSGASGTTLNLLTDGDLEVGGDSAEDYDINPDGDMEFQS